MKKILISVIITVLIGVIVGGFFYTTSTPEYVLSKTLKDINADGLTGLEKHLTSNAVDTVENIEFWMNKDSSLSSITQSIVSGLLINKLSETKWKVDNILRGKIETDVVIGFNYHDNIIGTISIKMLKESGEWKIDSLDYPNFEKVLL